MHLDVQDLRDFYYRTQLGRVAQRAIRDQLQRMWGQAAGQSMLGQTVVGYGFAAPLLRPWLAEARRVLALMPGPQGVMPWPSDLPNVSLLCEEASWPLPTGFVDRLVMMHGLETSDRPAEILAEASRILAPRGRAIFVVPNRTGLWARGDGTPFGFGRPYSARQLEAQLRAHGFTPERSVTVLHAPPSQAPFWLRSADMWEKMGRRLPWLSGGVLMIEASKQLYAPTRGGFKAAVTRPLKALEGVRALPPEPALRPQRSGSRRVPCPVEGSKYL